MNWYIVGLGNPGPTYTNTRHNAGFVIAEYLREKYEATAWKKKLLAKTLSADAVILDNPVTLILPQTFMNLSGKGVQKFLKTPESIEHCIVIHDDVHLPIGTMKISTDRGDGGHNGVTSLMDTLKSKAFIRIRIGVAPKVVPGALPARIKLEDYVLGKFKPEERETLRALYPKIASAIESILINGSQAAMNTFNTK